MGVIAAERIKLTSTRSPWWCSLIVVGLAVGFAALFGLIGRIAADDPQASGAPALTVDTAFLGISGFGVMVLAIMATLTVTSEYRFGIIRTTFQAVPNRLLVIGTKAGLVGLYAAALTTVLAFAAYAVAKAVAGDAGSTLVLEDNWRALYAIPILAFLNVVLAIGIGVLVRQSAAAISLIVLWQLIIEPLVGALGKVGREISAFLPFQNASRFALMDESMASGNWHWGVWGSLVYFIAFVALVTGVALLVVNKRDA
ncbi:ABC transporter permease [Nocardia jinanensis]|uniref:ABC transporter, membrane protein n=1 Tax=Nocardia jinanensis TaxID=382504 RepID=A0A917RTD1_9NOCA|nr:ABC transporter permease [Nocardia jinanensis]GGL27753.1 putative ABC transporter, membrane protein [Nocardia jinanensis]